MSRGRRFGLEPVTRPQTIQTEPMGQGMPQLEEMTGTELDTALGAVNRLLEPKIKKYLSIELRIKLDTFLMDLNTEQEDRRKIAKQM